MKISTILHKAADKHLAHDTIVYKYNHNYSGSKQKYSCCAIESVLEDKYGLFSTESDEKLSIIKKGLVAMGCPVKSLKAFKGDAHVNSCFVMVDIQGQRYFWLKWAALMAEEQGQ